mmetsp:Transcript_1977/g.5102  ORF Transcript_1977/g.5102 Transcript_1977/m.5102 type:complete len:246 (-) Transcript_1977:724-1461(-)
MGRSHGIRLRGSASGGSRSRRHGGGHAPRGGGHTASRGSHQRPSTAAPRGRRSGDGAGACPRRASAAAGSHGAGTCIAAGSAAHSVRCDRRAAATVVRAGRGAGGHRRRWRQQGASCVGSGNAGRACHACGTRDAEHGGGGDTGCGKPQQGDVQSAGGGLRGGRHEQVVGEGRQQGGGRDDAVGAACRHLVGLLGVEVRGACEAEGHHRGLPLVPGEVRGGRGRDGGERPPAGAARGAQEVPELG